MRMCPISPALSDAPAYSLPFRISPAPMPVPNVQNTMFSHPLPAPYFHSAIAQAFASFCKKAGIANRAVSSAVIGILSQPGRFGGDWMIPRRESSGPPQLTPIAAGDAR